MEFVRQPHVEQASSHRDLFGGDGGGFSAGGGWWFGAGVGNVDAGAFSVSDAVEGVTDWLNRGTFPQVLPSQTVEGACCVFSHEALQSLVSAHGYWVIALIVGLESMGILSRGRRSWFSPRSIRPQTQRSTFGW